MNTRWQSIRDRLYSLGYTDAPTQANLDGMFVEEQEIRPDRLVELARGAVQHILEGLRKDSLNHEIKAVVHIGLAWQEEPGKPMGQAIQKGYIDLNHANLNLFMNWLNKTFALGVR